MLSVGGWIGKAESGGAEIGAESGIVGGGVGCGICTTIEHWGQVAFFPAAAAGTFNVRPQLVQRNSICPSGEEPKGAVFMPFLIQFD